jgi:hypothetical protein
MILKDTDAKSVHLVELASLLSNPGVPADKQALIERELKFMRAGMKGESESAYDIDFYSGAHKNRIVIHDLRLEHNGRVAQIDHGCFKCFRPRPFAIILLPALLLPYERYFFR